MKDRTTVAAAALALALAGAAPAALAQQPPPFPPEHQTATGHEPGGEHTGAAAHEGFHHPPPMNWTDPTPEPRREVHEGGEAVEVKGPPPFVGPLINFAILAVLLYMAVRRAINPALAARRAAMETEIAEATRLRTEAEAMHREYSERLANLDREVALLKAEFVKAGEAERDRLIAEARERARRLREEGDNTIEQEMKRLKDELRREAVLAATSAAEEAVRKGVTPSDQQRLADDYIRDLAALPTTDAKGAQA